MANNLIVGQSGGCTAVLNATLAGVIDEAMAQPAVDGIYGMVNGVQGLLEGELVDLRAQSPETLAGLKETPSAALGSCRFKPDDGELDRLLGLLRRHEVRYFLYAGGNDSADTANRLDQLARERAYELFVIGLPKTIDNDLPITDHCPGYGSVARYLAISTLEAGLDTEAMRRFDPVKIIEVMGRDAGWLAGSAALGKRDDRDAPHLIYFPEFRLELDGFLADVQRVYDRIGYAVAIVPERITDWQGNVVAASTEPTFVDAFGHGYFDSPASYLVQQVRSKLGLRARFDKPGTLQRMSIPLASRTDLDEAYMAGRAGLRHAVAGESGSMVTLVRQPGPAYACTTGLAPLADIANTAKLLPRNYVNGEA
ncbi:MAG TPA: diphosphate--fructose-6-phosphate 1-phosphotransferase, partial [Chloroflexota bacterium]|nr:diphosphate--fructose-6-phosphate 1-phosphotransferase [Chloroflexota bacterium]